jgi:hypothetical protein
VVCHVSHPVESLGKIVALLVEELNFDLLTVPAELGGEHVSFLLQALFIFNLELHVLKLLLRLANVIYTVNGIKDVLVEDFTDCLYVLGVGELGLHDQC